jgi:hypothetical protein
MTIDLKISNLKRKLEDVYYEYYKFGVTDFHEGFISASSILLTQEEIDSCLELGHFRYLKEKAGVRG